MSELSLDLPCAFGGPCCQGVIRSCPEDFFVDEISVTEPDGQGEHALLHIEKRDSNTDWVAGLLARHADVPRREVSYAGMKDRNAVTRQWFSVRLAGKPEPDWNALESAELKILSADRHGRKLRSGALKGNRFRLRVRELHGDLDALDARLELIRQRGIPNYFGEQRFGREGSNLDAARKLLAGELKKVKRQKRGIFLSAARSYLFNRVLARRVGEDSWDIPLAGDRLILDGSHGSFLAEGVDDELRERCRMQEVHPSGPLWGRGRSDIAGEASVLERAALEDLPDWCDGLERLGLQMERRPLRAAVRELEWRHTEGDLILEFALPRGSYATSLLREWLTW
jgi:tRNA pseudouridine13 synthase